jgi:hypothetical protein
MPGPSVYSGQHPHLESRGRCHARSRRKCSTQRVRRTTQNTVRGNTRQQKDHLPGVSTDVETVGQPTQEAIRIAARPTQNPRTHPQSGSSDSSTCSTTVDATRSPLASQDRVRASCLRTAVSFQLSAPSLGQLRAASCNSRCGQLPATVWPRRQWQTEETCRISRS